MARGRKTGGRQKGTPNKATANAREALGMAFNGIGGVAGLIEWAADNKTEFFKLWGRLVPAEIQHATDPSNPMRVEVVFRSEGGR